MNKRSGFQVMRRLIGLVRPLTGYMLLAIAMGLIGHLCAAFITVAGGLAAASVLGFSAVPALSAIFFAALLFALLRGGLRYAEQACNHFIAFKLLALLRAKVFFALRRLAPAKLEGRGRGDLINLITSDIELLEVFYAHTISPIAIAVLFCAILCALIGAFHPLLALVALAAYACVGAVLPLAASRATREDGRRFRAASGKLASFVLDSLRGLDEIQQYGQGEARLQEMEERTAALSASERRLKRNAGLTQGVTHAVILAFDLAMLLASSALYLAGQIDFLGVLLPTLLLMSSFGPCVALANLGSTLTNTFAAGNRVLDILDEEPAVQEITGRPNIAFTGAAAKNVSFDYGSEAILQNVSANIERGSIVGVTGRSGSGKSTLLKLFLRFWETKGGAIELSGKNVNDLNTNNLREMESYVTQETHLFHDSIRANLRIAKQNATDEEIAAACKKASVHDFIASLPQGYDTPVGELGDTLSGGERQRLGLARAFLHDADFLLLDEPTSNLDSLNEAVILRSLREEKGDRTVVLVSHRESTLRIADRSYSVENGRVS